MHDAQVVAEVVQVAHGDVHAAGVAVPQYPEMAVRHVTAPEVAGAVQVAQPVTPVTVTDPETTVDATAHPTVAAVDKAHPGVIAVVQAVTLVQTEHPA
jgi:hypothetical protein